MTTPLIRFNFGCGENRIEGFENWDSNMDIRQPIPYPDECSDFILAEHVIEHITAPEAFHFMKECHRLLASGGTLRICVPELERLDRDKREDIICNHGHLMVYNYQNLRDMLTTAGFRITMIHQSSRKDIDGHWKIIGEELDTAETLRVEAIK